MKECEHRSLDDCQKLLKKGQKKLKASGNVNKAAHKRSEFLTENLDKFMKRRQLYEVDRKCATDLLQIIKQTKREKLEWVFLWPRAIFVTICFHKFMLLVDPIPRGSLLSRNSQRIVSNCQGGIKLWTQRISRRLPPLFICWIKYIQVLKWMSRGPYLIKDSRQSKWNLAHQKSKSFIDSSTLKYLNKCF